MDAVERDIIVAAISALGLILVAVIPLTFADLRSRRQAHQQLDRLHRKTDELLEVTNSVHDEEQVDGDDMTLGKLLRQVAQQVQDGFTRNDETHGMLRDMVRQNSERLHDHGERLEQHQQEINELKRRG